MAEDSCPIPKPPDQEESRIIRTLLALRIIAVIGMSTDPQKPGRYVPEYLQAAGKIIIPVNPLAREIAGLTSYPDLASIPATVDLALVFRQPQHAPHAAREAVAKCCRGLWLQSGIVSVEAAAICVAGDVLFVQDRCMMVEHRLHRT